MRKHLEPEAVSGFDQAHVLLASIAISLKRIADKLEGPMERRVKARLDRHQWPTGFAGYDAEGTEQLRSAQRSDN